MKRRILASLLTLVMMLSLLPTAAWAVDGESEAPAMSGTCGAVGNESNVQWALTKNSADGEDPTYTLTISGFGDMADYAVGNAPWHVTLGAAANCKQINKIELPSGLTRIGDNAFLQAAVTEVEIPNTVVSIGTNAFWNCNTIRTILPASVQELGATAFYGTFVVNVDANNPYFCSEEDGKVLYSKDKTTLYQVSQNCADFTIPSTVTTINDFAMNGCANVTGELVIPNNVQTIGRGAFENTGFTSLTLGSSVKEIGKAAFKDCTKMTGDLVIPASVTTIGENAFVSTGFNGKLDFQAQIEEFPAAIFKGLNFTSVSFSGSVKSIGDRAFENCKKLATVTFGQGLETVGQYAFYNSGLSGALTFPDSLKKIDTYAFAKCPNITEITLPEGNATIEYAAFTGDTGVQKIKIPLSEIQFDKLKNEGYYIFTNYTKDKLETIVLGSAPAETGLQGLFSGSMKGLKTLVIGTDVSSIPSWTFSDSVTLQNGLYPGEGIVINWDGNNNFKNVATKYTVAAHGNMEQGGKQTMLTFETPEGKTCPTVTYLSTNESAATVDENGKIEAVGSVGQKATIKAQYDGTTFAKVDVTIGTSVGDDFYSIDPVIADQTYTGSALKPAVKVTKNGSEITDGFKVEYSTNTNVGKATATVKVDSTVIGTATFNIVKATPTVDIIAEPTTLVGGGTVKLTVTSNGVPAEGKVEVTCEGVTVTKTGDGTFSALLPNETRTYTFTASYDGDKNHEKATDTCEVSVMAYYVPGAPTYPATAPAAPNGTVTVTPANASKGANVTVTVKPNEGYELGSLTVKDANGDLLPLADLGNGKFGFVMPASKVSVEASFVKTAVSTGFADVPADAFFADAVKWAVDKDVTNGLTDTMFGPYEPCTRGQIITFLWRAAGSPEPKTAVSFADVPAGSYYAKAVAWAIENGITNGMTETTFAPDATCTRGQSVTFLYRALKGSAGATSSFVDVPANAFYADAVGWAVSGKVTDGTSDTTFSPDDNCTRGQIVTFLYRAYQGK